MTTVAFASDGQFATTAQFRAMWSEFSAKLQLCGLIKTGDTGQIDWLTAVVPTVIHTVAGFEMYRFDDALQATKPVFIKIEYGYGFALSVPTLFVTVGTGTNGSGTLTGTVSLRKRCGNYVTPVNQTQLFLSNMCVLPGYVMALHKRGVSAATYPNCGNFFMICRTVDDNGVNNGDGVFFYSAYQDSAVGGVAPYMQCISFGEVYQTINHPGYSIVPGNAVNTQVSVNEIQVYKHFGMFPQTRLCGHALTILYPESPDNHIFSCAPVGATSHTFMTMGYSLNRSGWWSTTSERHFALVYQ